MSDTQASPPEPSPPSPRNAGKIIREHLAKGVSSISADGAKFSRTLIESGLMGVYAGALLYVMGWAYADRYFDIFGINIAALDRDAEGTFYIYALWALRDGWAFILVSVAGLAAMGLLLALLRQASAMWKSFAVFVIAAVVVASFAGAFRLGQWRANTQVPELIARDYYAFPRVIVTARQGTATVDFLAAKNAGEQKDCLRKLYMDRKNIYLYPGYANAKDSTPPVYVVPLSEVAAIEIVKNRGLCWP